MADLNVTAMVQNVLNALPPVKSGNQADSADSFLALLNIGKEALDNLPTPSDTGDHPSSARDEDKKDIGDNAPLPVAAHVTAPVHPALTQNSKAANDEPRTREVNDGPPADKPAPPPQKAQPPEEAAAPSQDEEPVQAAVAATPMSPQQAVADETLTQAGQALNAGLEEQLGNINHIIASIIQLLTGAATADGAQTPVSTVDAAPSVTPLSPAPVDTPTAVVDVSALLAGIMPKTAQAAADSAPAAGQEVALLTAIQNVVQQLQRFLQAPGTQENTADAPATNTATFQSLVDTLAVNVASLSQMLAGQDAAQPQSPGLNISQADLPQLDALKQLLKDGVAQVRGQLQKLQTENDNIFARTLASLKAQMTVAAQDDSAPADKPDNIASAFLAAAPAVSVPAAAQNDNTPQASAVASPQATVQAVAADTVQPAAANTGSHTGGNASQQGQGAPMPVGAASAGGQTSATDNTNAPSFARMLNQPTQARPLSEQVVFNIKTALGDGSSRIRIQLEPADLGKLDIKLHVGADGKTGVIITADNRGTLDLLQRDAAGLARALADAGLAADSGSLSFNFSGNQQQEANAETAQGALSYQKAQPEEDDYTANVISRSYVVNLAEGLDIKI